MCGVCDAGWVCGEWSMVVQGGYVQSMVMQGGYVVSGLWCVGWWLTLALPFLTPKQVKTPDWSPTAT